MVFSILLVALNIGLIAWKMDSLIEQFKGIKSELKRSNDLFEKQINQN